MKKWVALFLASLLLLCATPALACTTVIIGKDVSADGSLMFGRTEDRHNGAATKLFEVVPAQKPGAPWTFTDVSNGFTMELPAEGCAYTQLCTAPALRGKGLHGIEAECSANEYGVYMSATESIYANDKALAADPLVPGGVSESNIPTLVMPYVKTAREGVERLGALIDKYGSAEGNGVVIADKDEAWYMEIYTGRQWVAVKTPDDAYAVIANDGIIGTVNAANKQDVLMSASFVSLARQNGFLEQVGGLPHASLSYGAAHRDYSQLRVWAGQRFFSPSLSKPYAVDTTYDMFVKPDKKIALADVMELMRYRYEDTEYNVNEHPENRPIGIDRTAEAHIFQIRKDAPAVQWFCLANPEFSVFLPTYTNISRTPESYRVDTAVYDANSAFWRFRSIAALSALERETYGAPVRAHWKAYETELIEGLAAMDAVYAMAGGTGEAAASLFELVSEQALADADALFKDTLYAVCANTAPGSDKPTAGAPAPTAAPAPEEAPAPTAAPAPEEAPAPTEAPAPEETPAATAAPTTTAAPAATETPAGTAAPKPAATAAPKPAGTAAPKPALTAAPKPAAPAAKPTARPAI